METFHLFHLAACWKAQSATRLKKVREEPPLATSAVEPKLASATSTQECEPSKIDSVIRAAAAHMVFASRTSQDFITPQAVDELEHWTAQVSKLVSVTWFNVNLLSREPWMPWSEFKFRRRSVFHSSCRHQTHTFLSGSTRKRAVCGRFRGRVRLGVDLDH